MTERIVDARGVPIFVRETGAGSPVLLLHGFPQTGACWRRVAHELSAAHRVIVPDLPGFGRSGAPPAFDAGTIASVIADLMDAAGAPRAAVVGHDWGGVIGFRLALDHPARVERLAVVNAPFRKVDLRRGWHFLALNLPILPEIFFAVGGDRAVDFMLRYAALRKGAFAPEALDEYHRAFRARENRLGALAYYRTMARPLVKRRLRQIVALGRARPPARSPRPISVPTMIAWGMQDPVLPFSLLDGIERHIPGVRIEPIEGCGHFVPEECPEGLVALLTDFLQ